MPVDALRSLQALTAQLGREPSLDELYRFVGRGSGAPAMPHPLGPVQDQDSPGPSLLREVRGEAEPGALTRFLRENELLAQNPELRDARDAAVREFLYGTLLGLGGPGGGGLYSSSGPRGGGTKGAPVVPVNTPNVPIGPGGGGGLGGGSMSFPSTVAPSSSTGRVSLSRRTRATQA